VSAGGAKPTVSVVIAAYTEDRWAELGEAVQSLRTQTVEPLEIAVVCDYNTALFTRASHELTDVIVVENHDQRGLGGARNSGISATTGDIVAFMDDDARVCHEWIELLQDAYADVNVAGVGGSITPVWSGGRPRWFPEEFDWVVGCTYRGMAASAATVRNLIGCNMSFRRSVLEQLGGFRLGYGCDETDLCIRLGRRWPDSVLIYEPRATAFHRIAANRGTWAHFRRRCYFEGGSKAVVTWLCGAGDGLSSERRHAFRTLPAGVARELAAFTVHWDPAHIARAGALVAGLAFTTAGYLTGRASVREAAEKRGWNGNPGDGSRSTHGDANRLTRGKL
jgi:glycosyltransferase involved in cell wall biosynthesis